MKKKTKRTPTQVYLDKAWGSVWGELIQKTLESLQRLTTETFRTVHILIDDSNKQKLQIKILRKRWIHQLETNKDLEARVKALEMCRSRFDGV